MVTTDRHEQILLTHALLLPLEPPYFVLGYLSATHAVVILAAAVTVSNIAGYFALLIPVIGRWRCRKRELCPANDDLKGHGFWSGHFGTREIQFGLGVTGQRTNDLSFGSPQSKGQNGGRASLASELIFMTLTRTRKKKKGAT